MVLLVGTLTGLNKRFRDSGLYSSVDAAGELITGHQATPQVPCLTSRELSIDEEKRQISLQLTMQRAPS